MFNSIKLFLLRFFAKDLDAILYVFTKLDAELDKYIAHTEAEVKALDEAASKLSAQAHNKDLSVQKAHSVKANIGGLVK